MRYLRLRLWMYSLQIERATHVLERGHSCLSECEAVLSGLDLVVEQLLLMVEICLDLLDRSKSHRPPIARRANVVRVAVPSFLIEHIVERPDAKLLTLDVDPHDDRRAVPLAYA